MRSPPRVTSFLPVLLMAVAACVVPVRDYDVERIAQVTSLDELMHVQATVADPRFRLAKERADGQLSPAEFAEFADMAARLAVCARRLPEFSTEPEFHAYARTLEAQALELGVHVDARDGSQVVAAALAIKTTCKDCHWDLR